MAETVRIPKASIPGGADETAVGVLIDLVSSEWERERTFKIIRINKHTVTAERVGDWSADATTMRPRTPDNKGQGGSRKVSGNPQVNGDSALQRATKVKEGH